MGYGAADKKRNEKINAEQKVKLESEKIKIKNEIKYLQDLSDLSRLPAWKESIDPLITEYKTYLYRELLEETTVNRDGTSKQVEPGELMIRQRTYNRVNMFIRKLERIEERLKEAKFQMSDLEKSEEKLNTIE